MQSKQRMAFEELESIMEVISKELQITIIGGAEWAYDSAGNSYYRNSDQDPWTRFNNLNEVVITPSGGYTLGSGGTTNWGGGNPWASNYGGASGGPAGTGGSSNGSTLEYGPQLIAQSNLHSASAFAGYVSLFMTKNAALLYYTAQNATELADIANALKATKVMVVAGKSLGIVGAVLTGLDEWQDGDGFTWGDLAKVGIGVVSTLTPYGWAFSVVDLATGIVTGTTLTDRIGGFIDN